MSFVVCKDFEGALWFGEPIPVVSDILTQFDAFLKVKL